MSLEQFQLADPYISPKGNKISIRRQTIKRIIPLQEVFESDYEDMAELARIFNHTIVETTNGSWRWKQNSLICHLHEHAPTYIPSSGVCNADDLMVYCRPHSISGRAGIDLNGLAGDLRRSMFTMEEWMKFYMQMGYSLCGYAEVFGQHEAAEYRLPHAKPIPPDHDGMEYVETVIDYMRRVHKDTILSL